MDVSAVFVEGMMDNSGVRATKIKEPLSDDARKRLVEAHAALQSTVGQVVLAMSSAPRYRSTMLSELTNLVIDPLLNDRIAIAVQKSASGVEPPAIAIWATVSPEVDAKISEQTAAGVFPVRLKPADWRSGEIAWLLDVIAPTRELATAVLRNFNQVSKQNNVKIHPIVARLVDPEILSKLSSKTGPLGSLTDEPEKALN
ncbi:toxin-activating lysine-acyltransferase [Rhizobium sp. G187]|uniref:toxin-activating lysine-acyltransferase n=1 Tax=Rhizobium sp. G187 TaxID=3451352 RepID=UPI003EE6B579